MRWFSITCSPLVPPIYCQCLDSISAAVVWQKRSGPDLKDPFMAKGFMANQFLIVVKQHTLWLTFYFQKNFSWAKRRCQMKYPKQIISFSSLKKEIEISRELQCRHRKEQRAPLRSKLLCIVSKSRRILLHINKLITCNVHKYLYSCIDPDSLLRPESLYIQYRWNWKLQARYKLVIV